MTSKKNIFKNLGFEDLFSVCKKNCCQTVPI